MIDSKLIGHVTDLTVALTKMRSRQEVLFDDMQLWKKRVDEAEDHLKWDIADVGTGSAE